ncbi:MAG: hypothetical protein GC161_04655 [Planctomycetaceae bacterium]|nr:hypothetical protein [Planctomycetaceae bacterium]
MRSNGFFGRSSGTALAAALALVAAAPACTRPTPARPHLVLITVEGLGQADLSEANNLRQLAGQCVRFEGIDLVSPSVPRALALLFSGLRDAPLPEGTTAALQPPLGPGAPLPGSVDTLFERAAPRGFETAAVLSRAGLGLESGLPQGAVHLWDRERLETRQDGALPLTAALNASVEFLDARMARAVEHGALLWVHLDLAQLPAAEQGPFLDAAFARLSAALEADPRHVLAAWFLPAQDSFSYVAPFWLRVPGQTARLDTEVNDPVHLLPTLLARLGAHPPLDATPPFAELEGRDLLAEPAPAAAEASEANGG